MTEREIVISRTQIASREQSDRHRSARGARQEDCLRRGALLPNLSQLLGRHNPRSYEISCGPRLPNKTSQTASSKGQARLLFSLVWMLQLVQAIQSSKSTVNARLAYASE